MLPILPLSAIVTHYKYGALSEKSQNKLRKKTTADKN